METPTQILNLIAKGYLSKQIAEELKVSKAAVSKRLRHLEKKGYIHIQKKGIILELSLTAKGLAELNSVGVSQEALPSPQEPRLDTRNPSKKVNYAPAAQSKRLHNLGLIYQLIEPLKPSEPVLLLSEQKDIEYTPISLNHNTQAVIHTTITAKLTTTSLILYAPELYYSRGQPSIVAEAQAKQFLDKYAEELEARLNIRLKRIKKDMLYSERMTEESADEQHPLATEAAPEHKMVLARAPDGKERLVADRSKRSFAELETVYHRTAGEDADIIDKQFNAILDKEINLLDMDFYIKKIADMQVKQAELQAQQAQASLATQDQLNYYSKQIAAHAAAIAKLNIVLTKLDRLLSQRKLDSY